MCPRNSRNSLVSEETNFVARSARHAYILLVAGITTSCVANGDYRDKLVDPESGITVNSPPGYKCPMPGSFFNDSYSLRGSIKRTEPHEGVDFEIPIGTPVYAVASGFVKATDPNSQSGLDVIVKRRNLEVSYGHLHSTRLNGINT